MTPKERNDLYFGIGKAAEQLNAEIIRLEEELDKANKGVSRLEAELDEANDRIAELAAARERRRLAKEQQQALL